ncbi:MAG: hypothetical protein R3B06_30400 [Kofleriaceae bacterium]
MIRAWFRRLFPERRSIVAREPVFFGARLELDVVDVDGIARDVGPGGVFFATSAPIAAGVRGQLRRAGTQDRIPVRVTWQRAASPGRPAGLGLAFDATPTA